MLLTADLHRLSGLCLLKLPLLCCSSLKQGFGVVWWHPSLCLPEESRNVQNSKNFYVEKAVVSLVTVGMGI